MAVLSLTLMALGQPRNEVLRKDSLRLQAAVKGEMQVDLPLFQTKYTADPSPLVVGDTLFLYTSHDASPEDIPDENGTFTGTWNLVWERNSSGVGENRIILYALWDDEDNPIIAYSHNPLFGYADATTLQFAGHWQNSDGWTSYERGEAEPSF